MVYLKGFSSEVVCAESLVPLELVGLVGSLTPSGVRAGLTRVRVSPNVSHTWSSVLVAAGRERET